MEHFDSYPKDLKEQLLDVITHYPGLSLRELSRELCISAPLVKYHLDILKRSHKIISNNDGKTKRFYLPTQDCSLDDQHLVNLLRNPIVLEIVLLFLSSPQSIFRNQDLYEKLTFRSRGAITYHLNRLVEYTIIKKVKDESIPYHGFQLVDPERIKRLLDLYKPTPSMRVRFASIWINLFSNSLKK